METLTQQSFEVDLRLPQTGEKRVLLASQPSSKETILPSRKGKEEESLQCKYDARLASAALRQAAEGGFLVSPTRAFLLERCKNANQEISSLRQISFIHLTNFRIRTLGYIQSCRNITICILNNNYLTRFSALENCRLLKRLDLHSNQIARLPDEEFWVSMKSLLLLNLHDNGVGRLECIQSLSHCPNLLALTLYDTPISLKVNYRHHVVNSIWSLKALDHHVVGDDEIIEDAVFTKHFSAMNPALYIDLCPREIESLRTRTLEMELKVLRRVLSEINVRLAHGSPVIVMQRWVRGHLCRRKHEISYSKVIEKLKKINFHSSPTASRGGETFSLDYDTYLKNRRPGSKTPSAVIREVSPAMKPSNIEVGEGDDFDTKLLPTQLYINLAQLEKSVINFGTESESNITIHVQKDTALPAKSLFSKSLTLTFEKDVTDPPKYPIVPTTTPATAALKQRSHEDDSKQDTRVHEIPTYPLPPRAVPEPPIPPPDVPVRKDIGIQCMEDPEIPNHQWRIHNKTIQVAGRKPVVAELEPLQDCVIMNRETGRDIRDAIEHWHDQEISKPKPKIIKKPSPTKLKDNVSLATLIAVTKAYRDRDRTDNVAMKVDRVMRIQQERMQSKQIVAAFKDEKRISALNQRQEDRIRVADALQQAEIAKAAYLEFAQERKEKTTQRHLKRHKDLSFAVDFSNQHVSVSNALIRHDRQAAKEDSINQKEDLVTGIKAQLSEQAELVRRYMEHKQLVKQLNSGQEKARIDARILKDTNERFMLSRQRVAGIKARKAAVQSYQHTSPSATTFPSNVNVSPLVGPMPTPRQPSVLPEVRERKFPDLSSSILPTTSSISALPPVPPYPSSAYDPGPVSQISETKAPVTVTKA